MTGIVKASMFNFRDGTLEVTPDRCPVEDPHRLHEPRCYLTYPDGAFRACPYWAASTSPSNTADREHPSALKVRATALGARTLPCQVICHAQRRNRPPGA